MEGFLPLPWAVFWTVVFLPFLAYGIHRMKKLFDEHPEQKISLALSGAFIVILSSLKIPSVTGSSSHPTGTGMSVLLSGPGATTVICTIVLIFQATFMAHGGFTTLGANVFSMGIAGPFAAYGVFKLLKKYKINTSVTVFIVAFIANIVTYTVTSLQLTLVVPYVGFTSFVHTYATFFGIFTVTQIPIAIAEGAMMVLFFNYLAIVRTDLVRGIGYDGNVQKRSRILDGVTKAKRKSRINIDKSKLMMIGFIIIAAAVILLAYLTMFLGNTGGTDDAGANTITNLIPGFQKLTENFIQFGDFGISILFILQTAIGVLILVYVMRRLLRKTQPQKQPPKKRKCRRHRKGHGNEFNTFDTAAYNSPMLHWSPAAKLLLVFSLLVLNIASKSIWMPVLACVIGLALLLYGSSMRPPSLMIKLFLYAQTFIVIGALVFTVVMPGESVMSVTILGFTINFTDAGTSFALMVYLRATAALFLLFSFAISTPVPRLAEALRKLRFPTVFVEMMVLIYRYTFLLMESAEKMHLAAECKFGYCGYGRSMKTTSKLAVGMFMRSLDVAERGQVALQCRNYQGDFKSLSSQGERNIVPTLFCASVMFVSVIFFILLQYGVV